MGPGRARRDGAPMTDHQTRAYRDGACHAEGFPLSEVSDQLADPSTFVWVDLLDPDQEQLELLAGELGLHPLAVEDALEPHQRPKLESYGSHMFLTCHAIQVLPADHRLRETEVDAFISDRWLITVRKGDAFPIDTVIHRWDRLPGLARHGVLFLVYGLLDVVVDGYFDAVQAFDEYYDEVSAGIFSERPLTPAEQRAWFLMRQALVRFHRLTVPLREAVSSLMRRERSVVAEELYPYYQDVYDHILRVSESSEALRDLVSTIVETNISLRDYRQNLIMKKVTSWAAIIAVPTLITGYYGMNVPFPGAGSSWGVALSAALILTVSGALYATFRRNDWL